MNRTRARDASVCAGLCVVATIAACAGGSAATQEEVSYRPPSSGGDAPTVVTTPTPSTPSELDPTEREVDAALALAAGDPSRPSALMRAAERALRRAPEAARSEGATRRYEHMARALRAVLEQHPRYSRCDEAAYRLGQAAERAGRMDEARRGYLLLIQRFPASVFVPHAYLAFGEFFRATQDHDSSRQFYEQVARSSQDPRLVAYAHYRIGRAHAATANCAAAMQALQRAQGVANAPSEIVSAASADLAALGRCSQPASPLSDSEVVPPMPPLSSESELDAEASGAP